MYSQSDILGIHTHCLHTLYLLYTQICSHTAHLTNRSMVVGIGSVQPCAFHSWRDWGGQDYTNFPFAQHSYSYYMSLTPDLRY